jgi:tryptophanyl-tRNA synthetase
VIDPGSGALKQVTAEAVNEFLAPFRARRTALAADTALVEEVLRRGDERANELADETLREVREAMGMGYANVLVG